MAYPYYDVLHRLAATMHRGNFGLWYNKFIPIDNFHSCRASDEKGNDKEVVSYYKNKYASFQKVGTAQEILVRKHSEQAAFCESFSPKYEKVIFKAKLDAPLITGIGESHPHEVSLLFEHNMGIPYIPASGIKGIVRFAHTLGLVSAIPPGKITEKEGKECFDDEEEWTGIHQLFGTQERRGSVIFLDAYPEKVPELHVDIMNPHYGQYYGDDTNKKPPGDYFDPTPIKFLTVARGTVFIFRALVDSGQPDLVEKVKDAFKKALSEEGVGAKTAVGYGMFEDLREEESESVLAFLKKEKERKAREAKEAVAKAEADRLASLSEDERMLEEIKKLGKDTDAIAALCKKCLAEEFESSVYRALKRKLKELEEWKPSGSKQRKAKMKKRNFAIEAKIND